MNLKTLIATVMGLEARATEAFKAELAQLKADITGTIDQLKAELATAATSIASLENEKIDLNSKVSDLTSKLSEANKLELDQKTALRAHLALLPGHADFKENGSKAGASLAELIAAEINATNTAIASTGVKLETIPGAGGSLAPAKKTATRAQFEQMTHAERDMFFATGGKLTQ